MKHLLSIENMAAEEMREIFGLAQRLKTAAPGGSGAPLQNQIWALLFSKSSTRKYDGI